MTTGATGQLGLALPVQGELSGTWGDTVNNGITQYTNIAIAGTLTLTGDGAVTLANTTGDASASNITSTLAGAGTVTAQFAIVRVTGTLTVAKVVTAPSYSKTYTVVNAATGGIVTFKASGQTGVSVAVGESAFVYFNGTDYVKVSGTVAVASFQTSLGGLTPSTATTGVVTLAGTLNTTSGGTGLTSFTAGDVPYYASGSVLSKLAIGTAGQFLTSTGTAPQWSTLSGVAVTTFSAGTTGFTPSSATSGVVTLAGTLATTNGGTGLTSFTSGGVVYASSTSALATGSALTFNGTNLTNALGGSYFAINSDYGMGTPDSSGLQIFTSVGDSIRLGTRSFGTFSELARLNATGLGIGTSSPAAKLQVNDNLYIGSSVFSASNAGNLQISATTPDIILKKKTAASSGDTLGRIRLFSAESTGAYDNREGAEIRFVATANANFYQPTAIAFLTNSSATDNLTSEKMRLDSAGNLKTFGTISVGDATPSTSGAGITFPATQSASSNANTLDDYEEGTWTPAVTFGGGATGVTYGAFNAGKYTKVGRMVSVCGTLDLTSKGSSTGNISITGLPISGDIFGGASLTLYGLTFTGQAYGQPNGSAMALYQIAAGVRTNLTDTAFANDTSIGIQITYFV